MEEIYCKAHGEAKRGHNIKVVSVGVVMAHGSDTLVLKVGTLCIILITIRVNLVSSFMLLFKLLMEENLYLSKSSGQPLRSSSYSLNVAVISFWLNFLGFVQCQRQIMLVGPLDIS